MANMTAERASQIMEWLMTFNSLERKNTDEIGWVALKLSCTREQAERLIMKARKVIERVGVS